MSTQALTADTWTVVPDTGGVMILMATVTTVYIHTGDAPSSIAEGMPLRVGEKMSISSGVVVRANPGANASEINYMLG